MFERTKIKYEKEAGDGPFLKKQWSSQRTQRGKFAVKMVSISLRLDLTKEEDILLFVCGEAVEYHLVKLYTSCQVKLCLFLAF